MYGSMCNVYSSENSATQEVNNDWEEERTETTVIYSHVMNILLSLQIVCGVGEDTLSILDYTEQQVCFIGVALIFIRCLLKVTVS